MAPVGSHGAALLALLAFLVGSLAKSSPRYLQGRPAPKLQRYDLLLPFRGSGPVQYLLQGENGCFTWEWDRKDLISLEPVRNTSDPSTSREDQQCASGALISSIAPFSPKATKATIRATDVATGVVLSCAVNIDVIQRLWIAHQSSTLGLESIATLAIRAFNANDDDFATLSGLEFDWDHNPVGPGGSEHHLVSVPSNDARLGQEEASRLRNAADVLLVEGVSAGQENVSVVLQEWADFYAPLGARGQLQAPRVPSHWAVFTIVEEFFVDPPSPILLLVRSSLSLKLLSKEGMKFKEVMLPSRHYAWGSDNPEMVSVGESTGMLMAFQEGSTLITVNDTRSPGHKQSCSVRAVLRPSLVKMFLVWVKEDAASQGGLVSGAEPLDSTSVTTFHLVAGREYAIVARAYHSSYMAAPIIVSQADMCSLSLEERHGYWEPIQGSEAQKKAALSALREGPGAQFQADSTLGFVTARMEGKGKVSASVGRNAGTQTKAHASVAVQVCTPVSVEALLGAEGCFPTTSADSDAASLLRLPWLPGRAETVTLVARGGCGEGPQDYVWSSNDSSVATVSQSGQLASSSPGSALIRIAASVDSTNFLDILVQVKVPHSLVAATAEDEGEGTALEVPVGEVLRLAADFVSRDGQRFTCCKSLAPLVSWHVAHPASSTQRAFHIESTSAASTSGTPGMPAAAGAPPQAQADSTGGSTAASGTARSGCHCSEAVIPAEAPGRAEIRAEAHLPALDDLPRPAQAPGGAGLPGLALSWSVSAYAPLTLLQVQGGRGHGGYGFPASGDRTLCAPQGRPRDGLPCHGGTSGSGAGAGAGAGQKPTGSVGGGGSEALRGSAEFLCFTVLAPGASLLVKAEGGPDQWLPGREFVKSVELFTVAAPDKQGGVPRAIPGSAEVTGSGGVLVPADTRGATASGLVVHPQELSDGRLFELRCVKSGHYAVMFTRGHLTPTHSHKDLPAVVLAVTCTLPSAIVLLVDDTESLPESIAAANSERGSCASAGTSSGACSAGTGACGAPGTSARATGETKAKSKGKGKGVTGKEPEKDLSPDSGPAQCKRQRAVAVHNGRQLSIAAVALDAAGVPLANASSLGLSWSLQGCEDLASWHAGGAPPVARPWERLLDVSTGEGECFVSAKVVPPSGPHEDLQPIRDSVLLQVVRALSIRPPFALLLNHPDATVRFVLLGGTEDVQASLSNETVARILPVAGSQSRKLVHVSGLAPGEAALTATDEGLHHHRTATATVVVADVAWIRILSEDDLVGPSGAGSTRQLASTSRTFSPSQAGSRRGGAAEVSVEVGHSVCVPFLAGDDAGNVFPRTQLQWMQVEAAGLQDLLSAEVDYEGTCGAPRDSAPTRGNGLREGGASDAAALGGASPGDGDAPGVPSFVRLKGLRVGLASEVQLSAYHSSGKRVPSSSITVRVYPPLMLNPQALVLAPGALFALGTGGGPSAGAGFSSLKYSSLNESVAVVDPDTGLVTAVAEGSAVLRAVVEALGPWDRLSSAAEAQVTVRIPEAVALRVQSLELASGHTTAAFPTELTKGAEGLSADALSLASLCFDFAWTVSDSDVLELTTVPTDASRAGNKGGRRATGGYASANGLTAFVTAAAPGTSDLALSFECTFPAPSPRLPPVRRHYSASASLTVLSWPQPKAEKGQHLPGGGAGTPGGCPVWVLPLDHTTSAPLLSPAPRPHRTGAPKPQLAYSLLQPSSPPGNGTATGTGAGTGVGAAGSTGAGAGAGLGSSGISLLEGGRVRTHVSPAFACIAASDAAAQGPAKHLLDLAGCVRSAEIGQLALLAPGQAPRYAVELSVGAEHSLVAAFSDEFGIPFHEVAPATRETLRWETNRRDVVGVEAMEGLSLSIKALREGTATVRVWSSSSGCRRGSSSSAWGSTSTPVHTWSCAAFMEITVRGALILPSSPALLAGSTLTLELGQATGKKQPAGATWASSDPSVVQVVSQQRGAIKALRSGKAVVTFTSPAVSAQTTVTVTSAESVEVSPPPGTPVLSNHPPLYTNQDGYIFPVTVRDERGRDVGREDLAAPFSFRCTITPIFAGEATASLHSPSQGPACIFRPFAPQRAYHAAKQQQGDSTGSGSSSSNSSGSGSGSGRVDAAASEVPHRAGEEGATPGASAETADALGAPQGQGQGQGGRRGAHRALTVSAVVDGGPEGSTVQGSVEVKFVGGFQISEAHRKQVVLTQDANETTVTLLGNIDNLAVSWGQRDVLRVSMLRTCVLSPLLAEGVEYRVSLADPSKGFQDKLTFTQPLTGQQESILVSYKHPTAGVPFPDVLASLQAAFAGILPYILVAVVALPLLWLASYWLASFWASLRSAPQPLPPVQLNVAPFTPMAARYASGTPPMNQGYANGTPSRSYHSPAFTPSSASATGGRADVNIQNYTPGLFNGGTPPIDSTY